MFARHPGVLPALLPLLLAACGHGRAEGAAAVVGLRPESATVEVGGQQRFTATVYGQLGAPVAWGVREGDAGGVIDDAGLYTAPGVPGTFHVVATSVDEPEESAAAVVRVRAPPPAVEVDMSVLPVDRRTAWRPGIPGGIPSERRIFATLTGLLPDGTGDATPTINQAILEAHEAYRSEGLVQEVVLPEGTFRIAGTVALARSGVVLRGQGPGLTRLRFDGGGAALLLGRHRYGTYGAEHGPFPLLEDAHRGTTRLTLASADAAAIEAGDILCIDEEDDPGFVRLGDAHFEKRQPSADTHGPALREAGKWRSVTSLIRVVSKSASGDQVSLDLADPLHMDFRVERFAQVFHVATEGTRGPFDGVHRVGLEDLTFTGGNLVTNNVAYCWIRNVEADGNPGSAYLGRYDNPGGISGRSVDLFHAYRCEVRDSYLHHSRNISQGGGAYLLSLSSYTSESLVENNIVVFGNKLIVGNMMGGGNVIAYNYVDNARTDHPSWQEGAIDLNHQAFTHHALVEGNWATNLTSDTTHGNAGWHVFFRNFGSGQNSEPLYGPHPYTRGSPDGQYRRAAGTDGYHREATYVGNVLHAGPGVAVFQVDPSTGPRIDAAAIWRIGWGVDGGGANADDGTALRLLHRHGNWDAVSGGIRWDEGNPVRDLPPSLYLEVRPTYFDEGGWPWIDPTGATEPERRKVLPAKARFDAMAR